MAIQYTDQQIRDYVNGLQRTDGLAGNALYQRVIEDANRFGIDINRLDGIFGLTPGFARGFASRMGTAPAQVNQMVAGVPTPVPATPSPAVPAPPPTGLIGSEQALQTGQSTALNMLTGGANAASTDIASANRAASDRLRGFGDQAIGYADDALAAMRAARGDVSGAINNAVTALQPFQNAGAVASTLRSDLLGANGPQAQALAFQNFQNSPGQQYLQDQGEQAILRNASALGGLGGSRVLQELQRQGQGLSAQQLNTRLDQLAQAGTQGLQAASSISALRGSEAGLLSDLARSQGQLGVQVGQGVANFGQNFAANDLNVGQLLAGIQSGLGTQGANIATSFAPAIAAGRTDAGNALAQLAANEGNNIATQLGTSGSNLAALLSGTGQQEGAILQNLAQLLANLSTQSSGAVVDIPQIPFTTPNNLETFGQVAGGIGTALNALGGTPRGDIAMVGNGQDFAGVA